MQVLFQLDITGDRSEEAVELFCRHFEVSRKAKPFFIRLVDGVLGCRDELDRLIERFSDNWKLSRMSGMDRNIMRIATYELIHCDDIPPKVSINEAIDIGKKYGTENSAAFINGILDGINIFLNKAPSRLPDADPSAPDVPRETAEASRHFPDQAPKVPE